ncbi:Asp-tRNA(Asn)/Glu-tRNA(Gln) amidotransferase subunit GatA [bacterium]|nr:Asp-tRNA(Asn)/Glu-tRNA(Gln) amidotransferase subunit GatA [candidate division CSSED10-310 bacterium]
MDLTVSRLRDAYRTGEMTPEHVLNQVSDRLAEAGEINAFISDCRELAAACAARATEAYARGDDPGPLGGIPIAVKDNINVAGFATTCGSRILTGYRSPYHATVVERLLAAGAVPVGKTNCDEFAMGSSNETSAYGVVRNPHDRTRVPGGSSGGSAAAVAAGLCSMALGSDTGGSIRQPAAFCGVVGLKPTYGRVSRYGLVAFASSLDQIGPMTVTVEDAARSLAVIAGVDPRDSTSVPVPASDYLAGLQRDIRGLTVGLPREYFTNGMEDEVRQAVMATADELRRLGCVLEEVSLPHTEYGLAAYYIIATAEASANLARYDGVRYGLRARAENLKGLYERTRAEGFGAEVKRRIMLGTYVLSSGYYDAYYRKAQQIRTLIDEDFSAAFAKVDCLLTPTTPTRPFKLGEKVDDPLQMYLSDLYTIPVNLAGLPALAVPVARVDNLPVGVQLIGRHFEEDLLLRVGAHLERRAS